MTYLCPGISQKQQPCIPKNNFFLLLFMLLYHIEMYKTQNKMHNGYVKKMRFPIATIFSLLGFFFPFSSGFQL